MRSKVNIPRLRTMREFEIQREQEAMQDPTISTPQALARRMALRFKIGRRVDGIRPDGRYGRLTKTTFNPW